MEPTLQDFDIYLESYMGDSQQLAVLLDFDGTLAPIVALPHLAAMSDLTKNVLSHISKNKNIFISIISGRAVDDVRQKIGIDELICAGNHGLEILYPNGTKYNHQIPGNVTSNFEKMVESLEKITRDGSWIENKGVSLTFHYRASPEDQHDMIRNEASDIIKGYGYRANQAHCAVEAKPPVQWHKGKAAEYILNHQFGDDWRSKAKVVFAGDDTTDEDVFELLQGIGVTFRVTKDQGLKTMATFKLPSTESVTKLLQWIEKKFSN